MKRITAVMLALILTAALFSAAGLPVYAAEPVTLAMSSAEASRGGTVTLTLSIEQNPGINALQLSIAYDASVLELTGVSDAGILGSIAINETYPSPYPMAWIDAETQGNNTATGTLATLTFKVSTAAEEGDTQVTASCVSAYDTDQQPVTVTAATGTVSITNSVLLGDLNGDTAVDSADAIYLLYNTLFGSDRYPIPAGHNPDYNKDEKVDSADAIYLLYNTLFGSDRYPLA